MTAEKSSLLSIFMVMLAQATALWHHLCGVGWFVHRAVFNDAQYYLLSSRQAMNKLSLSVFNKTRRL